MSEFFTPTKPNDTLIKYLQLGKKPETFTATFFQDLYRFTQMITLLYDHVNKVEVVSSQPKLKSKTQLVRYTEIMNTPLNAPINAQNMQNAEKEQNARTSQKAFAFIDPSELNLNHKLFSGNLNTALTTITSTFGLKIDNTGVITNNETQIVHLERFQKETTAHNGTVPTFIAFLKDGIIPDVFTQSFLTAMSAFCTLYDVTKQLRDNPSVIENTESLNPIKEKIYKNAALVYSYLGIDFTLFKTQYDYDVQFTILIQNFELLFNFDSGIISKNNQTLIKLV